MLTRREMLARMAAVSAVLVLEGCDAIAELPTAAPYHLTPARFGTTYYVDASGDDANDGTSPGAAWTTIERVNAAALSAGDQVLFAGGQVFSGALLIDGARVRGTAAAPVRFASFGVGRATIRRSGENHGIEVRNADHVWVENLELDGVDRDANARRGVVAICDDGDHAGLVLRDLHVHGWGNNGVTVGGHSPAPNSYRDILLERIEVTSCRGAAGIAVWGSQRYDSCRGITLRDCRVTDITGQGWTWSGSGIVLFETTDFLVEYCEVGHTGRGSGTSGGGPVGLWVSGVRNGVIRHCVSHDNRAEGGLDGGAFDLDAGTQNVTLEYCYSHDNEGPALLLAQWSGSGAWFEPNRDNVVRYCISENDGRRNHSVVSLWRDSGAGSGGVRNTQIYGNSFVVTEQAGGRPLLWVERSVQDVTLRNNLFVTAGSRRFLRTQTSNPGIAFQGNAYHAPEGTWEVDWNRTIHRSLTEWRAATGRETVQGAPSGTDADPRLVAPGGGGAVADPRGLAAALGAYRLQAGSPMPGAGVDLRALGAALPATDFFGSTIPTAGAFRAIGADSAGAGPGEPEPPGNPKIHTLSDDFAGTTLDGERWRAEATPRSGVVQANQLELRLSAGGMGYAACTSRGVYDLRDSHAAVEIGAMATGEATYTALAVRAAGDDTHLLLLAYDSIAGRLSAATRVAGASAVLWSTPYLPAEHRHWRVRESNGVVHWETSTNGANWTLRHSAPAPFDLSALELRLFSDRRAYSNESQTAVFRRVNRP